jgi:hypothetical protein
VFNETLAMAGLRTVTLLNAIVDGKQVIVEYESDSELRDSEQMPLLEEGGIDTFILGTVPRRLLHPM